MSQFKLIFFWLLLLVPTIILGAGALYLLKGEEQRLSSNVRATAYDRVAAISGNIDLAIADVKDGLIETLKSLPSADLGGQADLLEEWKRSNPLIRNVFIWEQGRGLLYPDPEQPASDEEAGFVRRYLPLFASQSAWQEEPADEPAVTEGGKISSILAERKELRQLAKQAPVAEDHAAMPAPAQSAAGKSGWHPWFTDNRLHLLGWQEWQGGAVKVGVEVEMMALLGRLIGNFPDTPPYGERYALLDGNGKVFHQVGPGEIVPGNKPLAAVAVTALPHWQVAAYQNVAGNITSGSFLLVTSLLVGAFVVTIVFGGSLLVWQAHRNQLDARQKTSFVSNVSHELKTPLTTIRMYAELLGEKKIVDPDKQDSYLKTIIRESQRLTRLVNNVLDFSRLEQGRKEFRFAQFDLVELLHQLLDSQVVRIEDAGMQLTREIKVRNCSIESDRDALEQILLNLIDNAIKYAAEGRRLVIELEVEQKQCQIRVRDNGPGVPADHRRQIFEKFHRIDDSLTARQQGSGLGLSIAHQLAEGLGGTLTFRENRGSGACFELRLPLERTL